MSISSEITRIKNAKTAIAASITNKGVTVPETTKIDGYSALIDSITGSVEIAPFNGAVYPWITLNDTEVAIRQYQNGVGLEGAKTVILPNVTTINGAGFMNCAEVECFDIGQNIQTINTAAFNGCTQLTKLIIRGLLTTKPSMTGSPIANNSFGTVYVPDEYLEDYKSNENWSTLVNRIKPISEL